MSDATANQRGRAGARPYRPWPFPWKNSSVLQSTRPCTPSIGSISRSLMSSALLPAISRDGVPLGQGRPNRRRTGGGAGSESSTLTPLLKRLEAAGNLTRTRDPSDERQVRVRLTSAGRALQKKARDIPRCIIEATGLSFAGLGRLQREIAALRQNLLKSSK